MARGCKRTSKTSRRACRRAARRRQEEITVPGEKGVSGLLANPAQQVLRPVSRELLPLPIPVPDHEKAEGERLRGLSGAVRSRVNRARLGQCWGAQQERDLQQNVGFGGRKLSVCDAAQFFGPNVQCLSGDERCRVQQCRGSLQSALRFSAWVHWERCQTGHLQGGSRGPARSRR